MKSSLKNGAKIIGSIIIVGGFLPDICHAQLYTWKDPETGKSRMSNVAPPWYRGGVEDRNTGPRTVVTIGAEVLDDSAKPIDETNYRRVREKISAHRASQTANENVSPPDDKRGATQASPGPSNSTGKSAPEANTAGANSKPPRRLTAQERAEADEQESREEMANKRGSPEPVSPAPSTRNKSSVAPKGQ